VFSVALFLVKRMELRAAQAAGIAFEGELVLPALPIAIGFVVCPLGLGLVWYSANWFATHVKRSRSDPT
jgi:hypothetical protein